MAEDPVARVFARSDPPVRALAAILLGRIASATDARIEPRNGSIHICRKSAFAGLHPRKSAVLLNLRTAAPIDSGRIRKVERVSANRFHNELLLDSVGELDDELFGWIADAAALADR
jgi:uncharacterized protein DUF5655